MEKPKILVFIDWFLPGYKAGGPIRSVANIVLGLKEHFNFYVATSDRDLNETKAYPNITANEWLQKDGYQVIYLSPEAQNRNKLKVLLQYQDFDKIYFNSLFSFKFTLLPLYIAKQIGITPSKILLAPRGMLGKHSLKVKSGKKKVFLALAKLMGLYKGIGWHASTQAEVIEIETVFGSVPTAKAQNMPSLVGNVQRDLAKKSGELKLIFIGRVCPIKNLLWGLQLLNNLPSSDLAEGTSVKLDIFGPLEDAVYWEECQKVIASLPKQVQVNHRGEVPSWQIPKILPNYHFSFSPTKNENYGHAIVESLLSGVPVIISDKTPWASLTEYQAGWACPIETENQFLSAIHQALQMPQSEYDKWVNGSLKYAADKVWNEEVVNQNIVLFSSK